MSDGAPEVIASDRVFDGWFAVRIDRLRYASGREGEHTIVEAGAAVTVVPIDGDGRLLLVRQHRPPVGRELLELPAGSIDAGESPEACAERELQEEAGVRPRRLERLGGFFTAPGYCDEYLYVFLATDLVESKLEGDEESIAVEAVTLDDALAMVASGELEDAKTLAGLLLYLRAQGRT